MVCIPPIRFNSYIFDCMVSVGLKVQACAPQDPQGVNTNTLAAPALAIARAAIAEQAQAIAAQELLASSDDDSIPRPPPTQEEPSTAAPRMHAACCCARLTFQESPPLRRSKPTDEN